jgi:hypothetical protein
VALLVIIIGAALRTEWHTIARVIEITGYVLMGITGAGIAGGATYGALRVRRRVLEVRPRRIPAPVRAVITDARAGQPALGSMEGRPAFGQLEPPRQPGRWAEIRRWTREGAPAGPVTAAGDPSGRFLIGDADRERLVAVLREHYADGRLTLEALRRRAAVVLSASYADEAAAALAELPPISAGER